MKMRPSLWAFCYCFLVIIERLTVSRKQTSHNSMETHTQALGEKSDVYLCEPNQDCAGLSSLAMGMDTEGPAAILQ